MSRALYVVSNSDAIRIKFVEAGVVPCLVILPGSSSETVRRTAAQALGDLAKADAVHAMLAAAGGIDTTLW